MTLYFNTKIIGKNLYENNFHGDNKFFEKDIKSNQIDILKYVIKSYSYLNFSRCIFNIELDDEKANLEIESIIKSHFKTNTIINFSRPYDKDGWLSDINLNLKSHIDEPCLFVQNHDHPFIDHQSQSFEKVINYVFNNKSDKGFKKVFYYSHIPELLSSAENKKWIQNKKFKKINNLIYQLKHLNSQVDAIAVMTPRTIMHIHESITREIDYFGRIDWKGLYFKDLNVEAYFYPREFFRHFEGYNHVSGIKIIQELTLDYNPITYFNSNKIDYYYNLWLRLNIFLIRDHVKYNKTKSDLIHIVHKSIDIFSQSVLEEDLRANLNKKEESDYIKTNLTEKIFLNLNTIFSSVKADNKLLQDSMKSKLLDIYNNRIKHLKITKTLKKLIK